MVKRECLDLLLHSALIRKPPSRLHYLIVAALVWSLAPIATSAAMPPPDAPSALGAARTASPMQVLATARPFTGAFSLTIPFALPPAKGMSMPPLHLSYDSHSGQSDMGVGWDLSAGVIARSSKRGIDYSREDFVVFLGSATSELTRITAQLYRDRYDALRLQPPLSRGPGARVLSHGWS